MVMATDDGSMDTTMPVAAPEVPAAPTEVEAPENQKALVKKIQQRIKDDKDHHEDAFEKMREDMYMARHGCDKTWPADSYKANLVGRHVKQKTASLYAKNPRAVARRKASLDFTVWDENPDSLKMAFQTIQMAQQMMAQAQAPRIDPATGQPAPQAVDPMTGQPAAPAPPPIPPEMQQAFETAMQTVQDYQQGVARRQQMDKFGKTLEILFAQALAEQKPVDFKTAMKQCARRAITTGVGYAELGFQRDTEPRPGLTEQLADARQRLDHLKRLTMEVGEGELEQDDPEIAELEASIAALQSEPEIVLREGLIIDFPPSTRVIPDKLCRQLVGFIGARWVTVEYLFTPEQVEELFGVDLAKKYNGYTSGGKSGAEASSANFVRSDDEGDGVANGKQGDGLACVWKHYDKSSGLCYYVCDGYDKFLREPAAPDVFVEDFWPVYALTFNALEDENEKGLYPPSDVRLMRDMQMEYNRSRQGMRDHRWAARPRWVYMNGLLEDEDVKALSAMQPFDAKGINLPSGAKIADVLQVMPVPGVDPNLYETGQLFSDIQLVGGGSEAQFGGIAKATATESAISASATKSTDGAAVDDLDAFLTVISRASGQILMKEMSEEQVKQKVGPGAVWPVQSLAEIAGEIYLEVEAGSSGKPNQAIETQNFKELAPLIMQIPGVNPAWLAKEAVKRLDDKLDVNEALAANIPAIVAQNRMQQTAPPDPNADPNAQGDKGGDNGPKPQEKQQGSDANFGSNQV